MTKYQSDMAKRLHERFDPEDTVGDKDEIGWAGLYLAGSPFSGAILREDNLGFVSIDMYQDSGEIQMAWEATMAELSNDGPEPEDGDYVIDHGVRGGYGVTPLGLIIPDYDDAIMAIYNDVEGMDVPVFGNVWDLSDHKNFHLKTDFDEEVARIKSERGIE